ETNTTRLNSVSDEEAAAIVRRTVKTISDASGRKVKGWLGSGLAESWNTLDQLVDSGVEYVADWVNDDQPYKMTLDDGSTIMSIPYSVELNDKPAFESRNMTAEQFDVMLRRQFDTLWRESEERALVMGIALHPYIIGFPHRIGALDSALEYICRHEGVW